MDNPGTPSIGFVGWNPFQLIHVKRMIAGMDNACFILANRRDSYREFHEALLTDPKVPVRILPKGDILTLDGEFDVLVFQTPIANIDAFKKTRVAMLQYGYAKEPYNYGPWRSLAELNITYGPYAKNKISHLSPTEATGNPRYDDWLDAAFHRQAREKYEPSLAPKKKTLLYAPTWGDLSSVDKFFDSICTLGDQFNVLLKMHHNTDLKEHGRKDAMDSGHVQLLGANDDLLELLAVTDIVLSDYSGAIFDAIYCQKPVILLNTDVSQRMDIKLDEYSLEYAQRNLLGVQVDHPQQLRDAVTRTVQAQGALIAQADELRSELFVTNNGATERAIAALQALADGQYRRSQSQEYISKEIKTHYSTKRELARVKKELKKASKGKSFFGLFRF